MHHPLEALFLATRTSTTTPRSVANGVCVDKVNCSPMATSAHLIRQANPRIDHGAYCERSMEGLPNPLTLGSSNPIAQSTCNATTLASGCMLEGIEPNGPFSSLHKKEVQAWAPYP